MTALILNGNYPTRETFPVTWSDGKEELIQRGTNLYYIGTEGRNAKFAKQLDGGPHFLVEQTNVSSLFVTRPVPPYAA